MKNVLYILIGIAILIVVLRVFSFITGFLFWGVLAAAVVAIFWFAIRKVIPKNRPVKEPKGRIPSKTDSDIERLIKEMEEMTGKS